MEKNVSQVRSGLHQDNSYVEHPKDKLRFALNAVSETQDGDQTFISNEEGNDQCFTLTPGYIPLGKVYVGNNETVIFSVASDESSSEIGIADADCNYTVLVNFDLGFKINQQIDATFRLRKGCERVVYWVDPKIRHFNLDRRELFKSDGSTKLEVESTTANWVLDKFYLFRRFDIFPVVDSVTVEEDGDLLPGSYAFSIQYMDEDFNPTEWITDVEPINIYNDIYEPPYAEVRGSSTLKTENKDFPKTNKSISLNLSQIDTEFPYYRVAIIEASSANGSVTQVNLSAPISTNQLTYKYTGNNAEGTTTIEEIQQLPNNPFEAGSIPQLENRLLLSNVKYAPINYCKLQKYASKITVNAYEVSSNSGLGNFQYVEDPFGPGTGVVANSPLAKTTAPDSRINRSAGFMSGEIYSFGIVYIFEDGTRSPVYHIPGRGVGAGGSNMSTDNELADVFYTDENTCEDYWGVDNTGKALKGKPVRHHRLPKRNNIYDAMYYLNFSNIELPPKSETGGLQATHVQIVYQERTKENMTVIDTCVLTPLFQDDNGQGTDYISNAPTIARTNDNPRIVPDKFQYISLLSKFRGITLKPDRIVKIGELRTNGANVGNVITQDVAPGTTYDPNVHTTRARDSDGFDLNHVCQTTKSTLFSSTPTTLSNDVDSIFQLTPLEREGRLIYNVAADNKADFIELGSPLNGSEANARAEFDEKVPIVRFERDIANPYEDFRSAPFIPIGSIFKHDGLGTDSVSVFGGDTYLNEIDYTQTVHHGIVVPARGTKSGLLNFITGVLGLIAGAVLIATGVGAAAGISAAGFGASQLATGVRRRSVSRAYEQDYETGLEISVQQDDITPQLSACANNDDEIQWYTSITKFWSLESSVNIAQREGLTKDGVTDFIDIPDYQGDGLFYNTGCLDYPKLQEDYYVQEKLTSVDSDADGGRLYKGFPDPEIYDLNPDYYRTFNNKLYFPLPLEYDCCSDCLEEFPYRTHYSQQSFQEERADNFRVFLPNNYRDVEGEKGKIVDVFTIQNNLYLHTEEALYHLPQNVQERITGDIISFIGTGEFFSIPPRRIVDSEQASAGTLNKWSRVKTPYGVFFVSRQDAKIYKFDGQKLEAVTNNGLYSWSKENIPYVQPGPFGEAIDNPSNPDGIGYHAVYDSRYERVIFTKIDFVSTGELGKNGWTLSYSLKDNDFVSFHSYIPRFYFKINDRFYSWNGDTDRVYEHNIEGVYQRFYGTTYPHIIEYVSKSNPVVMRTFDSIALHTEAKEFVDEGFGHKPNTKTRRDVTFNKAILYNNRQCSGELTLTPKVNAVNYMQTQVANNNLVIPIDNNEGIWSFNGFRDIVSDTSKSVFLVDNINTAEVRNSYFIDKVINPLAIDENKDWTQLESFRDKYLVVRLIFDNFDSVRLTTNYSVETENISIR